MCSGKSHIPRLHKPRCGILVACLAISALRAWSQAPPHLDILSATVEEQPPIYAASAPSRTVVLRLELAGAVPSPCGPDAQEYGFLIDSDRDRLTGVTAAEFEDLGVDAKVAATCDPGSGLFVGPAGTTVSVTGPSSNILEIRTTVQRLPSLDLSWIAFAREGTLLLRLPEAPAHGGWATHEISLF
jgi:hypothetical protein